MNKLIEKWITKDNIAILVSLFAIILSLKTCSQQNKTNELSQDANKIAQEANKLAKDTSDSSLKFTIINAEAQWDTLRDSYDEVDYKILTWEKSKNLKRDGTSVDSLQFLEKYLDKLKPPEDIKRLYRMRHEKYIVLKNVAEQYKPFEERLTHINFLLPSAPVLPRPTLVGVSGSGISIK
jgi:hypothetical protein